MSGSRSLTASVMSGPYGYGDREGLHIVVTGADDAIWLHEELYRAILDEDNISAVGVAKIRDGILTVGTAGEGLGVLRYRITGERAMEGAAVVAVRIKEE